MEAAAAEAAREAAEATLPVFQDTRPLAASLHASSRAVRFDAPRQILGAAIKKQRKECRTALSQTGRGSDTAHPQQAGRKADDFLAGLGADWAAEASLQTADDILGCLEALLAAERHPTSGDRDALSRATKDMVLGSSHPGAASDGQILPERGASGSSTHREAAGTAVARSGLGGPGRTTATRAGVSGPSTSDAAHLGIAAAHLGSSEPGTAVAVRSGIARLGTPTASLGVAEPATTDAARLSIAGLGTTTASMGVAGPDITASTQAIDGSCIGTGACERGLREEETAPNTAIASAHENECPRVITGACDGGLRAESTFGAVTTQRPDWRVILKHRRAQSGDKPAPLAVDDP